MNKLLSVVAAITCICFSLILLLFAFASSNWISTCMPVASLILIPNTKELVQASSYSNLRENELERLKREEYIIPGKNQRDLTMNRQLETEKDWLSNQLAGKRVCAAQGYFQYCITGDGLFQIGDYQLCVSTNVPGRVWSKAEKMTVIAIIFSASTSVASIVLLFFVLHGNFTRIFSRMGDICITIVSVVTFLSGTSLLLGLLPVVVQSTYYIFNSTNFYNDMVHRLATIYSAVMEVNWSIKDGDMPDVQLWARNVVANMADLGLDRDFYLALTSAVLVYMACCCLLLRSSMEPERPQSPSRLINKQS